MQRIQRLRQNIGRVYMGNPQAVDRVIVCLLAGGHVLIEDAPGVGKTVLAHAVARSIDCHFTRIQLTPDLLPADVLGVSIYSQEADQFTFKPGPIFTNILLADEINRTTPRTQSALLEAMNERQVTIDGQTRPLDRPFMVLATQNPFEYEGTYFLPESQLDRFLMRLHLGYPTPEAEAQIITSQPSLTALPELEPVMTREDVLELQDKTAAVRIEESLVQYVVELAEASRAHEGLRLGLSTRGTIALTQAARATALLNGRDYTIPEDIIDNVVPVCAHRVIPDSFGRERSADSSIRIMEQLIESVAAPA